MIGRNDGFFGYAEYANLSVETATKSCLMPGMTVFVLLFQVLLSPLGAFLIVILEFNIAKHFTRYAVRGHHWRRATISVGVFAYAPLTRRCVEILLCKGIPHPTEGTYYLGMDMSKECWYPDWFYPGHHPIPAWSTFWNGGVVLTRTSTSETENPQVEHFWAFVTASIILVVYGIGLPVMMARKAYRDKMKTENGKQRSALNPSPWDVTYRTVQAKAYYWYALIMILKLVVNAVYLYGQYFDFAWELCLQVILLFVAAFTHYRRPYILPQ